ncbi:MAG: isochorismatase family protein [Chloroflexi bacterium]|nr:isochorismatase family protein [Chloroflexota bacterium]
MTAQKHAWEDLLPPRDRRFLADHPGGKRRGFGQRPCLIVIDMQYSACGEKDEDIFEMRKKWPGGCGHEAWEGIRNQQKLLPAARAAGIPIIYTRYIPQLIQFDGFAKKRSGPAQQPNPSEKRWQIVEEIKPQPGEIVLDKSYASVLYGTPLMSWLIAMRVDTVLVVGNSTGGCVRASTVDLITNNFNVAVIEDCVFDRVQLAHAAALLDMWMKYSDVIWLDEALGYIKTVKDGEVARQPVAARS